MSTSNVLSESGWTKYLYQSSWSDYKDGTHFAIENTRWKEASAITGNEEEEIDSSMASDASSGPQQQRELIPVSDHEQDHVQTQNHVSCARRIRRFHQDLDCVASSSSTDPKARKSKIRRVNKGEDSLLHDTASSSFRIIESGSCKVESIYKQSRSRTNRLRGFADVEVCRVEV